MAFLFLRRRCLCAFCGVLRDKDDSVIHFSITILFNEFDWLALMGVAKPLMIHTR